MIKNSQNKTISLVISLKNRDFRQRVWQDIRESVSGTELDFTSGSIKRAIFLLSIPMVLEMAMEAIFAVVDIYFVSKLGADAVATVGITESLLTIIYAIGMGLSTATTAIISRRIGEKKNKEAGDAAVQAILTAFTISLLIAIPGLIFAKQLLILMGGSTELVNNGYHYPMIMLAGNSIIMLLFVINAVFRSAGDAALSMRVLVIANLLNIILDPILIFGLGPIPAMGIKGAAIATSIGRGTAVIYQFYILFRGNSRISISWENLKIRFDIIRQLIKLSLGGIGQSLIATSSWIGMVRIISVFGSEVLAGYTIAIRIIIFSLLPSWGISNASATLVGQNLGAKQSERAEKSVWTTGKLNMIVMSLFGILFFSYPDFFIRLFVDSENIITAGAHGLRIISIGFISYGLGMVLVQSLNGAGDTVTPTWINFLCFWVIEIPLAYILALKLNFEEQGVYIAIVVAETMMTLTALLIFKKGKWKLKQV